MPTKYRLSLNLRIESTDRVNHGDGCLQVNDQIIVSADSFMEVAQILGRFHDLTKLIEKERAEYDRVMYP